MSGHGISSSGSWGKCDFDFDKSDGSQDTGASSAELSPHVRSIDSHPFSEGSDLKPTSRPLPSLAEDSERKYRWMADATFAVNILDPSRISALQTVMGVFVNPEDRDAGHTWRDIHFTVTERSHMYSKTFDKLCVDVLSTINSCPDNDLRLREIKSFTADFQAMNGECSAAEFGSKLEALTSRKEELVARVWEQTPEANRAKHLPVTPGSGWQTMSYSLGGDLN